MTDCNQISLVEGETTAETPERMILTADRKIALRAAANDWISRNFPTHRKYLRHDAPQYSSDEGAWSISLRTMDNGSPALVLGSLLVSGDACILRAPDPHDVLELLADVEAPHDDQPVVTAIVDGGCEFYLGDGLDAADRMVDRTVDLLLTDPPYGISRRYTCEDQVPRRLRSNGSDFIMPKGFFGDWDGPIDPEAWTARVLPKVAGWVVIFCAQAQIGDYCGILDRHGFVAVGPMVWQKTNPVPFNHKYKPINAWEALVVGKRPGTAFNGECVHNVFVSKSPSPQQRIHPTQKPLPLIEEFVELFSRTDDLIFDPFAGSATTVVAARKLSRRVIAYEKDAEIYQLAAKRLATDALSLM
ncbi:MAG: site-specific DNA-methyltransferase [Acidimicrobiaceae bacterium]|nr:site-specific DNA-methyltransferase [Acidimicrobiaceae bacterium]MYE98247.1 site-specific DNA-methyltransferase [Acidimicrobiaceae bacterium]MYI53051.1 site-specific DNA-methyltransferase [Acidimicrobiaceae bacterium]